MVGNCIIIIPTQLLYGVGWNTTKINNMLYGISVGR